MEMESKYLNFNELEVERKTKVFEVRSKSDDFFLGTIEWDTGWRRYIFSGTAEPSKLDSECMKTLALFIDNLMTDRKDAKSVTGDKDV